VDLAILLLILADVPLSVFCVRFGHTEKVVARVLGERGLRGPAVFLTPVWLGCLGWVSGWALWVTIGVLLWVSRGCWWALGWGILGPAAVVAVEAVSPWPSYSTCVRVMKANLTRVMLKVDDVSGAQLRSVLHTIEEIERDGD
jgi:hypothetical protein